MFQGIMTFLLIFGLFIVIATAHNITFLDVPQYGDPRQPAGLVCNYVSERGDPPLHSVKWYRENNEIFRFTPGQQPSTRIFNSTIAPTAPTVVGGECDLHSCRISVLLPRRYNTQISFTCEVSTEGPRFAVVKETKHLTVAVALKEDPLIVGLPGSVQRGEDITLNCSTVPSMPPANIIWYIDGKPDRLREPWMENKTEVSAADADGLRGSWRALRLRVTSPKSVIALSCQATQPTKPAFVRATNVSLVVAQTPQISMFSASRSSTTKMESILDIFKYLVVYIIFSKCSALRDI